MSPFDEKVSWLKMKLVLERHMRKSKNAKVTFVLSSNALVQRCDNYEEPIHAIYTPLE